MSFRRLLLIGLFLSSCGSPVESPKRTQSTELGAIRKLKEDIRSTAPTCQYTPEFRGPSKSTCWNEKTGSGDADMMLFAGLLCLSGEEIGCETVVRSVGIDGRPWRSPGRIFLDPDNTFSRDMFLGLMAYLVKTHNTALALNFQHWLEGNEDRLCFDSCDMRVTTWGLMGEVWKHLGLPTTPAMQSGQNFDDFLQKVSASWVTHGYREHIIGVTILIRQHIGTYTGLLAAAAEGLVLKNPSNPFFRYLVEGNSQKVIEDTLKICQIVPIEKKDWMFEELPEMQNTSMGWDCLFLLSLLEGK